MISHNGDIFLYNFFIYLFLFILFLKFDTIKMMHCFLSDDCDASNLPVICIGEQLTGAVGKNEKHAYFVSPAVTAFRNRAFLHGHPCSGAGQPQGLDYHGKART